MSTIYDIAKKVGLSPSTVARVLSGRGYSSNDAKEKVMSAADELKYTPIHAAKALKSKITNTIMMCIPDITNPYYFNIISNVCDVMENGGYRTILTYTHHNALKELSLMESLKERYVDGLIMVSFDFNEKLLNAMKELEMPVVLLNHYNYPDFAGVFDCVYIDHKKATQIATEYCIQKGHKEILFLGANKKEQTCIERLSGYEMALSAAGLEFNQSLVLEADYTIEGGKEAFENALKSETSFSAVISCNDLMGIACMNVCREQGKKVPDDISLVTLDNTDYCLCTTPRLTSVDMMQNQIGICAAQCMLQQINKERRYKQTLVLSPELVIRDSVKELH